MMTSWIFFAVLAYFVAAIVSVLDKVILVPQIISRPIVYAAWIGIFGVYGLFLIPFGFQAGALSLNLVILSLLSGAIFIFGLYFLFKAIKLNEISRVGPVFGVAVSIAALFLSYLFLGERLDGLHLFAFLLLILGSLILSSGIREHEKFSRFSVFFIIIGAFLFASSFVISKYVYLRTPFLNGFVVGRMGELFAGILLLIFSGNDNKSAIFHYYKFGSFKTSALFVLNKLLAGTFFLLQNYAFFLGSVSLVQSLEGVRFAFLLIFTTGLSVHFPNFLLEKISRRIILLKILAIILIAIGFSFLALGQRTEKLAPGLKNFGVTFSKLQAENLGIDWREAYKDIFFDLGVKKIRLPVYWDVVQKDENYMDFSDIDWQIAEAEKYNVEIILVIGEKLPRWPECHIPNWAGRISKENKEVALLSFISEVVNRYKENNSIRYWQVENEPFLNYGNCPESDEKFLDKEISLVKSLDNRPIIVTDSGELSLWVQSAKRADVFGTTMYRIIWSDKIPGGYLKYPLPPSFFHMKANLSVFFGGTKNIIISELQAEPWGPKAVWEMSDLEKEKSMSADKFRENIAYAKEVGFKEAYFWGAEWWYYEKIRGNPAIWNEARSVFSGSF